MDEFTTSFLENLHVPSTYWKDKTTEYNFYFRLLLRKLNAPLEFYGLPKEWPEDLFRTLLWVQGYIAIFKTERWGLTFQPSTLGGENWFYLPEWVNIANPHYQKRLYIGKDCEVVKLNFDYKGILDIIDHYATWLAEASKGVKTGLVNAKTPLILTANNPAQSATLKKVYDKVQAGESLVVYKDELMDSEDEIIPRKEPFESWMNDFKSTYIVTDLLEDMQRILDSFYMEVGLPTSLDKKAHVLESEASFNQNQSQSNVKVWLDNLNKGFEQVNKHYGTNMEVRYRECTNDTCGDDERTDVSEETTKRKVGFGKRKV